MAQEKLDLGKKLFKLPRGGTKVFRSLETFVSSFKSQEEILSFLGRLDFCSSGGVFYEHAWESYLLIAKQILEAYHPSINASDCWRIPFNEWNFPEQLVSITIVKIDEGIKDGLSENRGYLSIVSPKLIHLCLKAMAAGIRPGPGASGCDHIIDAGICFRAINKEDIVEDVLWIAAVLHNKLSRFMTTVGNRPYSQLPDEALPIMLQAKREQMEGFRLVAEKTRPGHMIASQERLTKDHETLLWLSFIEHH